LSRNATTCKQMVRWRVVATLRRALLAVATVVCVTSAFGMAPVPPSDMTCVGSFPFADNFQHVECTFPPHISKFVTENADWHFKSAMLVPWPLTKKIPLRAHFDGYSADLSGDGVVHNSCYGYDYSDENAIVTRNCPGHYPHLDWYEGMPLDWGGIFNGEEAYGWRIAAMFTRAAALYGKYIDWNAGITLEGVSYGGATAILQSMLLPDVWWRYSITVVNASLAPTMFVKATQPMGNYWLDEAVRLAWGDYDIRKADITQADVKHIYYRVTGASHDSIVVFDLDFFRNCDRRKLACYGSWSRGDHEWPDPEAPPAYQAVMDQLYSGPDSLVRLDKMLPVFTNSTANYWGARGHFNLGLEWKTSGFVDTASRIEIPVRYRRHTNMGVDLPNQPESATFDFTVRRLKKFSAQVGDVIHYRINSQSGEVLVTEAGEVTIPKIKLASSPNYTGIVLTRVALVSPLEHDPEVIPCC